MSKLTEKWTQGDISALPELIKQIEDMDNSRALSDEYLRENGQCTRDIAPVGEWSYGIVTVVVDYVLPYLKQYQKQKNLYKDIERQTNKIIELQEKLRTTKKKLKNLIAADSATVCDLKNVLESLTANGATYNTLAGIIRDFESDLRNYEE